MYDIFEIIFSNVKNNKTYIKIKKNNTLLY